MTNAINGPSYYNGQLVECSLYPSTGTYAGQTVTFPTEEVVAEFSQDVAQHKRPYVPGARIESTGVNPIVFKVKAPFLFGLQSGNGETWGSLYPTSFMLLFQILTDTISPTCTFQHPTMGIYTVKPVHGSTSVSPAIRNGQVIEFELVQANLDSDTTSSVASTNEVGAATSSANTFETLLASALAAIPDSETLQDELEGIPNPANLFAQLSSIANSVSNPLGSVTAYGNSVINDLDQFKTTLQGANDANTANAEIQLEVMKSGVYSMQNTAPNTNTFVVPFAMTVAQVALLVQNTVEQVNANNPGITSILIPAGASIVVSAPQ
jgi:hypothetical protein